MAGLLDSILGSSDPSTADPTTGLLEAQRRQLAFSGIGNIGAILLAAGQPLMPGQRAQILSQLANVPGHIQNQQNSLVQQRLMNARAGQVQQEQEAQQAFSAKLGSGGDLGLTPDEQAYLANLSPKEQQEAYRRLQEAKVIGRRPPSGFRATPGGNLEAIPGGPYDPAVTRDLADSRRAVNARAIPTSAAKGIQENLTALRKIDQTLQALNTTPDSVGGAGSTIASVVPGVGLLQNRMDPEGVNLRALISDIGSLKIHDRSGAAVTAQEFPRLRPFIPSISDDPETVRRKLQNFRIEYESAVRDAATYYSPENGFRPYTPAIEYLQGQTQPAAPQAAPAAPQGATEATVQAAAPPVELLKEGAITTFKNGQQWTLQGGKPVRVQ